MTNYQCPVCHREFPRDLIAFLNHTDQHVIDAIKIRNPEWVAPDGICAPCKDYYEKQITGESSFENIGPRERQKRHILGISMLILSFILAVFFIVTHADPIWRLGLFPTLFLGMLGLIQECEKTCALLAETGVRNLDSGPSKIKDPAVAAKLKVRGRGILVKSVLSAALIAALCYLLPF